MDFPPKVALGPVAVVTWSNKGYSPNIVLVSEMLFQKSDAMPFLSQSP